MPSRARGRDEHGPRADDEQQPEPPLAAPAELTDQATVLRAQRTLGNSAVARALMRNPNAELEAKTPEKVKHTTGKDVDTYLDSSPFFKALVEEKVKGGTKAEGHVHIHTPEEFVTECVAYLTARQNPATGANYTEDEAKAKEPNINAFRDGSEIHVHENRGEPGTVIHESMHLFSHDDFRGELGFNANEGATELFAKKLCAERKIKRGDFYADQYRAVKKVADLVGEDVLANAYYKGDVAGLRKEFDAKAGTGFVHKVREFFGGEKKGGAGTFDKWATAMKAGKYDEANDLF
jgi:hypothetical protein